MGMRAIASMSVRMSEIKKEEIMASSRWLCVGLGNPGTKYEGTRHNIGFMAVDRLAARYGMRIDSAKFKGHISTGSVAGTDVLFLKPQTFMNLSGESVQKAAAFYDIPISQILVFHDELDLSPGVVRLKVGGGHGGHNGLRDIIQKMGGDKNFLRVRMGIGRPNGSRGDVTGWVLGSFGKSEEDQKEEMIELACDAAEEIMKSGIVSAQNIFHPKSG